MQRFMPVRWDNRSCSWRPLGQPTTFDMAQRRATQLGRRWITGVRQIATSR